MRQGAPVTKLLKSIALGIALLAQASAAFGFEAAQPSLTDLSSLSIEQLANLTVTSVSRRAEPLGQAPAAIYVITRDDIRRSGASSLPEILRLAPNLEVAQLNSSSYAISARGFNHSTGTANKLLVLIDGRVVYSPLFSGVFWNQQNLMIADIERIEVISGPAGTLWGANAVNGVINIITSDTMETQGNLADLTAGTRGDTVAVRHGGMLGTNMAYRVYALGLHDNHLAELNGTPVHDGWENAQGGFRFDWDAGADAATVQGDLYSGAIQDTPGQVASGTIGGENLLANWTRQIPDGSSFRAQIYYDNARQVVTSGIRASVDTFDVDTQYGFRVADRHDLVVGAGYRVTLDKFVPGPGTVYLDPARRALSLASAFAQDSIEITPQLSLTAGMKLEYNTYTGVEYMPDARLEWRISGDDAIWGSISRAVRTPSRFDRELINPGLLAGGPDFESEDLLAFELGYRGQPGDDLAVSVSAFYNDYENLRTVEFTNPFPLIIKNGMRGGTFGIEAWATYAVSSWWRLKAGANVLGKDLEIAPQSRDAFGVRFAGNDPSYQFHLRSDMDLLSTVQLELGMRDIAALSDPEVPGYFEVDAQINWQLSDRMALSVTGSNLIHSRHQEFVNAALPALTIPRSVTLGARWTF